MPKRFTESRKGDSFIHAEESESSSHLWLISTDWPTQARISLLWTGPAFAPFSTCLAQIRVVGGSTGGSVLTFRTGRELDTVELD